MSNSDTIASNYLSLIELVGEDPERQGLKSKFRVEQADAREIDHRAEMRALGIRRAVIDADGQRPRLDAQPGGMNEHFEFEAIAVGPGM